MELAFRRAMKIPLVHPEKLAWPEDAVRLARRAAGDAWIQAQIPTTVEIVVTPVRMAMCAQADHAVQPAKCVVESVLNQEAAWMEQAARTRRCVTECAVVRKPPA